MMSAYKYTQQEMDDLIADMREGRNEVEALQAENQRLREALERIANGKPPKSIYGEGIYWWCVETAKKALEQSDEQLATNKRT